MKYSINLIFFLLFILCLPVIHALDITDKSVESYVRGEYVRGVNFLGDASVVGTLELNEIYVIRSGLSLGGLNGGVNFNTFASAKVSPFSNVPLDFSLLWNYNGLFNYNAHSHTIMPIVTYNFYKVGISIGMNLRFSSFFNEKAIFESILSYLVYYSIIDNEALHLGVSLGNFNEFSAKNMGALYLSAITKFKVNDNWQVISEIELMQSGLDGFSTTFYGFAWKGGVRFSW